MNDEKLGRNLVAKYNVPRPVSPREAVASKQPIVKMFSDGSSFPDRWYVLLETNTTICLHNHYFGDSTDVGIFIPDAESTQCSNSDCIPSWYKYFSDLAKNGFLSADSALTELKEEKKRALDRERDIADRKKFEELKKKFDGERA